MDASQQNQHEAGIRAAKSAGFKDIDKYGGLLVNFPAGSWVAGGSGDFGVRGSALRENPNWSITPNITWLKGRHNIKTGFWYIEAETNSVEYLPEIYLHRRSDSRRAANQNTTGLSLASALLGFPNTF